MKRMLILVLTSLLCIPLLTLADVTSLRGDNPLAESSKAPAKKMWNKDGEVLPRSYVQQPPLIPHKIDAYQIDLHYNKCMSCHSWAKYREAGATKISQTHFKDRDGNAMADVAPNRYFCTQCHVPQANATPLVENTFKPVKAVTE